MNFYIKLEFPVCINKIKNVDGGKRSKILRSLILRQNHEKLHFSALNFTSFIMSSPTPNLSI